MFNVLKNVVENGHGGGGGSSDEDSDSDIEMYEPPEPTVNRGCTIFYQSRAEVLRKYK